MVHSTVRNLNSPKCALLNKARYNFPVRAQQMSDLHQAAYLFKLALRWHFTVSDTNRHFAPRLVFWLSNLAYSGFALNHLIFKGIHSFSSRQQTSCLPPGKRAWSNLSLSNQGAFCVEAAAVFWNPGCLDATSCFATVKAYWSVRAAKWPRDAWGENLNTVIINTKLTLPVVSLRDLDGSCFRVESHQHVHDQHALLCSTGVNSKTTHHSASFWGLFLSRKAHKNDVFVRNWKHTNPEMVWQVTFGKKLISLCFGKHPLIKITKKKNK